MKSITPIKTQTDIEYDIKIIEGVLAKKNAPSMKWQIDDEKSLCWDASIDKVTFLYKEDYQILQFAHAKYKAHFTQYMDEFFKKLGVN